jgi:diguanylate cyclase (GGDEF)-like protein/PAS domain S-box-containing protein
MIGTKIPRYLLYVLMLGTGVAAVMLSMFYAQVRWLADDMTDASAAEHGKFVRKSFEVRADARLHRIADDIIANIDAGEPSNIEAALSKTVTADASIIGLRFVGNETGTSEAGNISSLAPSAPPSWRNHELLINYAVMRDGQQFGALTGAFEFAQLQAESESFARELQVRQTEFRRSSYGLIATGTLLILLLCAAVVGWIVRSQMARIRDLTVQAEKLRDADFGESLPEVRSDAIGKLARVFNDMRNRLRATTISRDYLDSILSGMNEAIIVTTDAGSIVKINRATSLLLGYEETELVGRTLDFIADQEKSADLISGALTDVPKEASLKSKLGEPVPVSYTCSAHGDQHGAPTQRIYAAQNIAERQRAEQRIRYLARIDTLTKIPNRMQFQHLLQRAIARARRAGEPVCLLYVDIDHFKEINDTFGHLAGDDTLEMVAQRLAAAMPKGTVIGRLAGDEFAAIVTGVGPDPAGVATTDKLAGKLLDLLAEPFYVQSNEVFMTASLGIAYYPDNAPNVIDLIRNADAALYNAKRNGGNAFSYYVPSMNESAVERLMTKSKLKRAFERDELLVHYQPKYNLATGEISGAEALVRWELPERGLILPSGFIPIAEETHLIIEIGEWVLDKVCEDFRYWQRSVQSLGRVSVNLSLKQLRQPGFIERISAILSNHDVSPTSLELEITETTLMENPQRTVKLLDQLYALGLHFAIDDFGTGYSSLSALQQFPISTLKIDQSFVRDMATSPDDATLVSTIVQMGRNLNVDVVAEGVENSDQLALLQRFDCAFAQGLLFGDPMSSDSYLELLLAEAEGTDERAVLFA